MSDFIFNKKGNNPVFALQCLLQGLKLLLRPELRRFLIIPILVNMFVYFSVFFLSIFYLSDLIHQFIPAWLDWLSWLLWPLFFLSFFIASFFSFTLLANLIAAPFYGKLAARTLSIVSKKTVHVNEQPTVKVLLSEVGRLGYLLTRGLPLVILTIIPGLNVLAPLLWVLYGAWIMALEFMAYPLENEGLLFSEQRAVVKSVRFGALSFGGMVVLGLAIPVLNVVVPPAAVIGATVFSYKARS